jgi:hypothetical protein
MKKSDKKTRRSKYPKRRVITTTNPDERERFYRETDQEAPLGRHQIAAGTIQNPRNGLWQVWMSTNGLDLNYISAHKGPDQAAADVDQIKEAAARGDLYDEHKVLALVTRLAAGGDGKPQPLPEETVRAIGRDILHNIIEQREP